MLRKFLSLICLIVISIHASHDQLITERCDKQVEDSLNPFERNMYNAITYGASDKECHVLACQLREQKLPLSTAVYNILHAFEKKYTQEVWQEMDTQRIPTRDVIKRDVALFSALPKPTSFSSINFYPETSSTEQQLMSRRWNCCVLDWLDQAGGSMQKWYNRGANLSHTSVIMEGDADTFDRMMFNMNIASKYLSCALKKNRASAVPIEFPLYIQPVHTIQEAELNMKVSATGDIPVFLAKVPTNAAGNLIFLSQLAHIHELHVATFPTAHMHQEPEGKLRAWADQLKNMQTRIADALFVADDMDMLAQQRRLFKLHVSNHEKNVIANGTRTQLQALYAFKLLNEDSLTAQRFMQSNMLYKIARYLIFRR